MTVANVTLIRMHITPQENGENISHSDTVTITTNTQYSNLDELSSICDLIQSALSNIFGFTSFKSQQRETILATLAGKNVLAILSTGGGKSLTFMLPSTISTKLTIVISPIVSLIDDLFDRASMF